MKTNLHLFSYLVDDYDKAIAWFCGALNFKVIEDEKRENDKRWVVIGSDSGQLLLAKASNEKQIACIGNQFGGRVGLFLKTDNFEGMYQSMKDFGVKFLETPRNEAYGMVVVFEDLYGTKWDLLSQA